ncbi:MAG: hypothetical protein V1776_05595 [Candidatus Diapherotrites archaeon]
MKGFTELQWKENLDETDKNVFIVRIHANLSTQTIHSFALIFIHIKEDEPHEIVKVDGHSSERVHIHQQFLKPTRKEYHSRPLTTDTIEYYIDFIHTNWRWFLAQYNENYI